MRAQLHRSYPGPLTPHGIAHKRPAQPSPFRWFCIGMVVGGLFTTGGILAVMTNNSATEAVHATPAVNRTDSQLPLPEPDGV